MKDRGLEMISLLRDFNVGHNPITWVGHSKGGLFIKQILIHGTDFSCLKYIKFMFNIDMHETITLQPMKISIPAKS